MNTKKQTIWPIKQALIAKAEVKYNTMLSNENDKQGIITFYMWIKWRMDKSEASRVGQSKQHEIKL